MAQYDGGRRYSVYPSAEFVKMPPDKYAFRYSSENRHQGTISVTIRVNDYEGPVKAVLACVTAEDPPLPHPNKVKCPDKRRCEDGVCTIQKNITKKNNEIVFNQIGIIRVTKERVEAALRVRISNTDYPFVRNYDEDSRDIRNLTRLRLACQVLMQDAAGALRHPLGQVLSTRVTHYPESLKITDASHDRGAATGGLRVFLFTAQLPNSVDVVFRERDSGWRAQGGSVEQHRKVALQFTTPPYENPYCHEPVKVYYFMAETMDNEEEQLNEENHRDFTYLPVTDDSVLEDKKRKVFYFGRKNMNRGTWNIINGVRTGEVPAAAVVLVPPLQRDDGGTAAAAADAVAVAPPLQHAMEVIDIPPWELDGGHIPEPRYDNDPLPSDVADFVIENEPPARDFDTIARHILAQPLSIPRWLLEQAMEVDEDFLPQATNNQRFQEF